MAEAENLTYKTTLAYTAATALNEGEVIQVADGRAGVCVSDIGSGDAGAVAVDGYANFTKATGVVFLDGALVWWDHSANQATYKRTNDRDFPIGTAVGDATSGSTTATVAINQQPRYLIDLARDPFDTSITGTQGLNTMGLFRRGGAHKILVSSTNEAQKIDALSKDGFATGANAIVEFAVEVVSDGAGTVVDVSIGIANDTHATDADSITDSVFIHLNANDVNIYAESDDGTTEVAATDTTINYTEGTRFEVWIDMRDPTSVKFYVDGARVLSGTTFNVNASVATWKLLFHVEKTAAADTYEIDFEWLRARIAQK